MHKAIITNSLTISLNIANTTNYNADCDGDELNVFVPEEESFKSLPLAAEETVSYNKNGEIAQKLKQDSLRGAFSISLNSIFLSQAEAEAVMVPGSILPPPALLKPEILWTGKQVLSTCLPPDLSTVDNFSPIKLDQKIIRHGEILSGDFDKSFQNELLFCCKTQSNPIALMRIVEKLQTCADTFIA